MNSFIKTMDQISSLQDQSTVFYNAEMLHTVWETKPEIIAKLLPAPLKPVDNKPLVSTFIANYPKTSFGPPYKEAALFIHAECDGVVGRYCLAMPITDGMAMAMGREICGFPKKIANIDFEVKDGKVVGKVSRHGIEFFKVSASISDDSNRGSELEAFNDILVPTVYNVSYTKSIDRCGYLLSPTLIRENLTVNEVMEEKLGTSTITMIDSPHDPWAELEVVRMVGSKFMVSTNTLEPGENLYFNKIDPREFVPYSFLRWDWWEN